MTMARFLPIDRDSVYLFPPSVQDWLPETHLARYIANVIESLDLSGIERAYASRGSDAYVREKAEFDAKLKARADKTARTGRKPPGNPPAPPRAEDQVNLTDDESRIMKVAGGGFKQCYNAQAMVDTETMLIVVPEVTQAANDKQQVEPMIDKLRALPAGLNAPVALLADTGYFSADNVDTCHQAGIEPLIAVGREGHHPHWKERFTEPAPLATEASAVDTMKHTLKTQAGKKQYALRKQTVEPVFGIIKSVMKFRQFMLRGLINVGNEWTLVCLAWNLKRMAVLHPQSVQRT